MALKPDFYYSEDHEWINATPDNAAGQTVRVGITHVAADRLGEALSSVDIPDERLGLFFTCAHPTLREGERIVLILRFLAGWTTAEVAAAFLVDTTAMQQRIVRAKKTLVAAHAPFEVPPREEHAARLGAAGGQ